MSLKSQSSIPIVDLSPFIHPSDDEERRQVSRKFCQSCQDLGCVNIIGHGISDGLLRESFAWSQKLFALPHDDKMKAPHPANSNPHRGYSHPGLEKVYSKDDLKSDEANKNQGSSLRKIQDYKESYEIGSEHNPAQPNIWLPEHVLPGYREFTTNLYWELNKTARMILEVITLGLNLASEEKDNFLQLHSGHNNQLRLLHYPPVIYEDLQKQVVGRMPAHQDWSSFTMLFQDDCGGLELEDPRHPGIFLAAEPIPNICILNIGDMLQRFTNGLFPSALHRVTLPPLSRSSQISALKEQDQQNCRHVTRARYSIPYFVAPDNDSVVRCLPSCVTPTRPVRYEPVKFSEYGEWLSKYMYKKDGDERTKENGNLD